MLDQGVFEMEFGFILVDWMGLGMGIFGYRRYRAPDSKHLTLGLPERNAP